MAKFMNRETPEREAVIVGAGLSGIAFAIALTVECGIENLEILEASNEVGGTWQFNHYPGLAVDIPSVVYQLKSDLNPSWSRLFAPGHEIWEYCKHVVEKRNLRSKIRFNTRVIEARFDVENDLWRLRLENGRELTTRFVIPATGGLTKPRLPDIPGVGTFEGTTVHTAEWDDTLDLTGKRVAVIGTGATAVQLVPTIASVADRLDVYQRTPIWVLPKYDPELTWIRKVFEVVPGAQRLARWVAAAAFEPAALAISYYRQFPQLIKAAERLCLRNLEKQVPDDAELRARLTPRYGFGCKRPTTSNAYFSTFTRPNVELVTDGIAEITATGIRTRDNVHREIDVLILATGYFAFDLENEPFPVIGSEGDRLFELWDKHRYRAYQGSTVPGFPNLFLSFGPYLVPGLSILFGTELAAKHASRIINETRRRSATRVEVRRPAHAAHFDMTMRRQESTLFFNGACEGSNSYYFDRHGDAPLVRPGGSLAAYLSVRAARVNNYRYSNIHRTPGSPSIELPLDSSALS